MMNVPIDSDDPQARSDEFLLWLYDKISNDPEFDFQGFDERWFEEIGEDALRLFNSLKQRQFLRYEKQDETSFGGYGRSTLPTAVGLNKKAIRHAKTLRAPEPKVQPKVEDPPEVEVDQGRVQELEKDVAWFIYSTTGNMRTALNYLEDAKVYLQKEPMADKKAAEQEILAMGALELQIVTKEELEG